MNATTVVNIYHRVPYDVYIGRAGKGKSGYFGNPFSVKEHGESALAKYEEYFLHRISNDQEFRSRVLELRGKILACFCVPHRRCHGEIIAKWLDSQPL